MTTKFALFFVLFLAVKVTAQPVNELEKAYKRKSSELLRKFITTYTIDGNDCFDDTCKNLSEIAKIVSDKYINQLKQHGNVSSSVNQIKTPFRQYIIYNSAIKVQICEFDLFKWDVKITEFNLYAGKKTYRDSTFISFKKSKIISDKTTNIIPRPYLPIFSELSNYQPVFMSSEGISALNNFFKTGLIDKKERFLKSSIENARGVQLIGNRLWGQSIYFEKILFNKSMSQALITIFYKEDGEELYFEKCGNTWNFVKAGQAWSITS